MADGDARLQVVLDAKIDALIDKLGQAERRLGQFGTTASAQAAKVRAGLDAIGNTRVADQLKAIELNNKLMVAQAAGEAKEIAALRQEIALHQQLVQLKRLGLSQSEAQARVDAQAAAMKSARSPGFGRAGAVIGEAVTEGIGEAAQVTGTFGKALAAIGPAGLIAGAAIGVAAEKGIELTKEFLEATEKAIDYAAEIGKTAKTLGVSTEFLQEFNYAAKQSDVDVGEAQAGLKELNVALGSVNQNLPRAKAAMAAFSSLGFTREQLKQYQDAGELFPVLADRISKMGTAAEKAAVLKRLGLEALIPMLLKGADGFEAMTKRAKELGIVMDDVTIEKAEAAKKKLNELDDVVRSKLTVGFANFADTLILIKSKFAEAQLAGLEFIARLTGTLPAAQRASEARLKLLQQQAADIREGYGGERGPAPGRRDLENKTIAEYNTAQREIEEAKAEAEKAAAEAKEANAAMASSGVGTKTHDTAHANAAAEATAIKDHIEALIKASHDLDEQHALRLQLIEATRAAAVKSAQTDKSLTPATRASVIATAGLTAQADTEAENQAYAKAQRDHQRAFDDQMTKLRDDALEAQAQMSGDLKAQQQAEADKLAQTQLQARDDLATKIADDKAYQTAAGREQAADLQRQQAVTQLAETWALEAKHADEAADLSDKTRTATLQAQDDRLKAEISLADTAEQRRDLGAALLANEQEIARIELAGKLRREKATPDQRAEATGAQTEAQGAETAKFAQDNRAPLQKWAQDNIKAANDVGEAIQSEAVKGMEDFNQQVSDAIANGKSLGDVFHSILKKMESDAISFGLKMAESLVFGGGGESGPGAGGGIGSWLMSLIPHFAAGTASAPGGFAVVGEHGPELANLPAGSKVYPNSALNGLGRMSGPAAMPRTSATHVTVMNDLRGVVGDQALDAKIAAANQRTAAMVYESVKRASPGWQVDYQYERG